MIKRFQAGEKEYILVGTAHVSKSSVQEVRDIIREETPDMVAVELCQGRFDNLKNERRFDSLDVAEILKKGQGLFVLGNLLLSAYQKKIGESIGVKPGEEMIAAIEESKVLDAGLVLADRPIDITLKRVIRQLKFRDKINALAAVLSFLFSKEEAEEISEETIEQLKEHSVILDTLEDMGLKFPNVKKYLLDERDSYLAYKIGKAGGSKIVAVLGAAHLEGVYRHLQEGDVDRGSIAEISKVPVKKKTGSYVALALLILFVVLVILTFRNNPMEGIQNLGSWLLLTSTLGGLGTLLAGGHPLSILGTMVGSPIGAASPFLSSGLIGALVEAKIRKPQVKDFNSLAEDAFKPLQWRRNKLLRVFLIFFLGSFGSAIGNIIGLKNILSGFFGSL